MKKLLFAAAASIFCSVSYAQIEPSTIQSNDFGPKELKCTEEAISFRADIRAGWQLSSFRAGYTDMVNGTSFVPSSKKYTDENLIPEPAQLIQFENTANQHNNSLYEDLMFPQKTLKPLTQTGQFTNDQFLYNNAFKPTSFSFSTPMLN